MVGIEPTLSVTTNWTPLNKLLLSATGASYCSCPSWCPDPESVSPRLSLCMVSARPLTGNARAIAHSFMYHVSVIQPWMGPSDSASLINIKNSLKIC
jgi:hypothetical protein